MNAPQLCFFASVSFLLSAAGWGVVVYQPSRAELGALWGVAFALIGFVLLIAGIRKGIRES